MKKMSRKNNKKPVCKNTAAVRAGVSAILFCLFCFAGSFFLAVSAAADTAEPKELPKEEQAGRAEPVSVSLKDGEYSIEVNMTGGSGRASVSSPTLLTVRDGKAYAGLIWSSPDYDYMILGDEYFYNQSSEGGNSTFTIPIPALDEPVPVIADTRAMGDPVEISYTLTFYEESIGAKSQIPQEAAKRVLIIAVIIIVGGWFLDRLVKKKRR